MLENHSIFVLNMAWKLKTSSLSLACVAKGLLGYLSPSSNRWRHLWWRAIPPTYALVVVPVYGALMHEPGLPGMFLCHIQSSVPSHGAVASAWCCWLHTASQHQLLFRWWHLLLVLASDVTSAPAANWSSTHLDGLDPTRSFRDPWELL